MDSRLIYRSPRDRVEREKTSLNAALYEKTSAPYEKSVRRVTLRCVRADAKLSRCKATRMPGATQSAAAPRSAFMDYNCVHIQILEVGMDYVTVRELREKSGEIWQRVEAGEEFVITRNGKPFALLVHTEPTAVEDRLRALRLSRLAELARAIQEDSQASGAGLLTEEDIQAEIDAARRERRSSSAPQASAPAAQPPVAAELATKYRARRR